MWQNLLCPRLPVTRQSPSEVIHHPLEATRGSFLSSIYTEYPIEWLAPPWNCIGRWWSILSLAGWTVTGSLWKLHHFLWILRHPWMHRLELIQHQNCFNFPCACFRQYIFGWFIIYSVPALSTKKIRVIQTNKKGQFGILLFLKASFLKYLAFLYFRIGFRGGWDGKVFNLPSVGIYIYMYIIYIYMCTYVNFILDLSLNFNLRSAVFNS